MTLLTRKSHYFILFWSISIWTFFYIVILEIYIYIHTYIDTQLFYYRFTSYSFHLTFYSITIIILIGLYYNINIDVMIVNEKFLISFVFLLRCQEGWIRAKWSCTKWRQTSTGTDAAHSLGEDKTWTQINICSIMLGVNTWIGGLLKWDHLRLYVS